MLLFASTFLIGNCLAHALHSSIQYTQATLLILSIIIMLILLTNPKKFYLVGCACLFGYSITIANSRQEEQHQLPTKLINQPIRIQGIVVDLPVAQSFGTQLTIFVTHCLHCSSSWFLPARVRITDPDPKRTYQPNQLWEWQVRLKPIHGFSNFDLNTTEAAAHAKSIIAQGVVLRNTIPKFLGQHHFSNPLQSIRSKLQQSIGFKKHQYEGVILALTVGESRLIPFQIRELFNRTGTSHLLAISGLHIGMAALFGYHLVNLVWRRSEKACLKFPAQQAARIGSCTFAFFYAGLAGFSLPTQRALLMLLTWVISQLLMKPISSTLPLAYAVILSLFLQPASTLSLSFWLSFGAVLLLMLNLSNRVWSHNPGWKTHLQSCTVLFIGMIPLNYLFFQQQSLSSLLANLILIPLFSLSVVPICLGGGLFVLLGFESLAQWCWQFANSLLLPLVSFLKLLSGLNYGVIASGTDHLFFVVLAMGSLCFSCLPVSLFLRLLALGGCLPLLVVHADRLKFYELRFTLLDVGQGLAALVETQHHQLLFDTGPRYSNTSDAGQRVILPLLRRKKIHHLDELIISHGDLDHRGGFEAIQKALTINRVTTSEPALFPQYPVWSCDQPRSWTWDGIEFRVFAAPGQYPNRNDQSCLLQVRQGENAILLTGDIEARAERALIKAYPNQLKSTVLVAPHHGSATSSTEPFIEQINPKIVLFATGYENRFHFPRKNIVQRYQHRGISSYNTAEYGAIELLVKQDKPVQIRTSRRKSAKMNESKEP